MSEFEDRINSILSDPEEMEKISRMAAAMMGGGAEQGQESAPVQPDGELLQRLTKLVQRAGNGENDKAGLLRAMTPYLREDRRIRLQKAMRLAQLARLAGLAMEEYGGGRGV